VNQPPIPQSLLGLLILLLLVPSLRSQDLVQDRYSRVLSLSYSPLFIGKISVESEYHQMDSLAIDEVDPAVLSNQLSFAYLKKVKPWFALGLKLSYSYNTGTYYPQSKGFRRWVTNDLGNEEFLDRYGSLQQKIGDLSLFTEFDMIARNPDDALIFGLGFNGAIMQRRDLYLEQSPSSGYIYRGLERIRIARVFRIWFSLEWEEYLGKNWGYRLHAGAYAPFWFKPTRIHYATDIREGVDFGESTISRGGQINGRTYKERFQLSALFAGVSVMYRF